MQKEQHQFSGIMDLDNPNETIGVLSHSYAFNGRFRGDGRNKRFENIPGTRLITNSLPAGNNECIGAFYDRIRKRVIFYNWNSTVLHGIYIFSTETFTVTPLIINGTNTDGDVLGFTLDGFIYNINVMYGDETQGDVLYYTNSQKLPCQININQQLAGSYGTVKKSYLDVCKEPPALPPSVTYENDATVTVNNLRKKLVKIKLRNYFNNKDGSVTSSQGVLALPVDYLDTDVDKDPTKNCRLAITIPTGEPNVKKIEICGAIAGGAKGGQNGTANTFGDYFSIVILDKAELGIADNDLYTYRFYNDQAYLPISVRESDQLFDWVPLQANAQELLNGNVPIYGGNVFGFDSIVADMDISASRITQRTTQPPYSFSVSQSGDSGFGTGNIHAVVIGTIAVGTAFTIYTTSQTVTYTAAVATTADVITGLSAAAVLAGFTVVSSDTENLVITKTNESLLRFISIPTTLAVTDSYVYGRNSRYSFGLVYFDKKGRTNGVIFPAATVQTLGYSESGGTPTIPKISLSINHRPPDWAYYYQIVRTKNLTKSSLLEWVSDRTYKDNTYAYISIESLNAFIKKNSSSKFLAYSFTPNDRIRFIKVLSGTVNTIYGDNFDFEILSQEFNPEISGIVYEGQFIKIALPTTSGTFDFGSNDFLNYFIEIYTPAETVSGGRDVYYEFGERYTIGNPTQATCFHQGMLQNQSTNLATPATFEFTQGDYFYRQRSIQTGVEYIYGFTFGEIFVGRFTLGLNFDSRTYADTNITVGNSPLQDLSGWTYSSDTRAIIKMGGGATTTTFRVEGVVSFDPLDDDTFDFRFQDSTGAVTYFNAIKGITNVPQTQQISCSFTLAAGQHITPLGWSDSDYANPIKFFETELKIFNDRIFTVGIIDPSFSDYFEAKVNSDGRPFQNDPDAAESFSGNIYRWGLNYQPNTNINQSNRFYFENFDEIDMARGNIMRFKVRDRIMRIFQQRACSQVGIYAKFLQDSGNTNILTTTDDIITKNNVQYQGGVGIGDYPTNLVSSTFQDFFVNPYTGEEYRLSTDGLTNLSELFYGRYTIKNILSNYNKEYLRPNGSIAKIMKYFDYLEGNSGTILQGGISGSSEVIDYNFTFNSNNKGFVGFYNFHPEFALGVEDKIFSFKNGSLYCHDKEDAPANFYGTQYDTSIKLIFNNAIDLKKTFDAVSYQANNIWVSDLDEDILTSYINQQTGFRQVSELKSVDYIIEDGVYYAALLRDKKSGLDADIALLEGDYLQGNWLSIIFRYRGSDFSYIYLPSLSWQINQRNK